MTSINQSDNEGKKYIYKQHFPEHTRLKEKTIRKTWLCVQTHMPMLLMLPFIALSSPFFPELSIASLQEAPEALKGRKATVKK